MKYPLAESAGSRPRSRSSSELLGIEKGEDEIDGEARGDDRAEQKIEHGGPSGFGRPAGVEAHQGKQAKADAKIDEIEHGRSPAAASGGECPTHPHKISM
jgi:hypothetical protein